MLDIHTNNFVESWHSTLKSVYLGSARKQRTDVLVHILLHEVLPDFRVKVAKVLTGLEKRRMTKIEMEQRSSSVSLANAASYLNFDVELQGDQYSRIVNVRSFGDESVQYAVALSAEGEIKSCTCRHMTNFKSVC